MQASQIEIGGKYAMREKVSAGEPLIEVQVLEKTGRNGQLRVRRLSEPHAGLEEFVGKPPAARALVGAPSPT